MCAKARPFSICHFTFFIRHLKLSLGQFAGRGDSCQSESMTNEIWKMRNGKSFSLTVPLTHHLFMEAMKGVEPLSFGLQDRRSVIGLSYIAI
jgi:hypothetical protein